MLAKLIQERALPGASGTIQLWRSLDYFVSTYGIELSDELKKKIEAGAKPAANSEKT
jgi:hypothetical protein